MLKPRLIFPLIALAVLLGGCPYESKVPLDNPSVKINPALLGKWEAKSSSDNYNVTKADEYNYKIVEKKKDSKEAAVYKGYLSNVDGDVFLNLYEAKNDEEKKFFFYKVTLNKSATKVTLASATENIDETFEKPEELKAFFQKNKNISFFFEKEEQVFIKED
jgi:hypothetical protein